jgi:hypothetical protein
MTSAMKQEASPDRAGSEVTKKIEANDSREHRRIDIYSEVLLALKRNVTISS